MQSLDRRKFKWFKVRARIAILKTVHGHLQAVGREIVMSHES